MHMEKYMARKKVSHNA